MVEQKNSSVNLSGFLVLSARATGSIPPYGMNLTYFQEGRTATGRRRHSAALSTGAELLYNEGRFHEALELADMAWEADPEWHRNLDLVIEINRAQSLAQEEF